LPPPSPSCWSWACPSPRALPRRPAPHPRSDAAASSAPSEQAHSEASRPEGTPGAQLHPCLHRIYVCGTLRHLGRHSWLHLPACCAFHVSQTIDRSVTQDQLMWCSKCMM
jgi:hypothetical protein